MSEQVKPLIFLDIDGVLNHRGSYGPGMPRGNKRFAPECVSRLNWLIARTEADIVVSSTWRSDPNIMQVLVAAGVCGNVIGTTPQLRDIAAKPLVLLPIPRGFEISLWYHWHGNNRPFVILDDDSDMQPHADRHVHTSFDGGLLDEHIEQAVEILRRTPEGGAR